MGNKIKISIPDEKIAEFCRRHHIRRLSFFGSVISEHFTQNSDVDVLVEFEPKQIVGLIRLAGIELELSEIIGRKVDMRTPADLSRYFREEVISAAEVQYAEG
jgi:predicted nucleotidyltransferase